MITLAVGTLCFIAGGLVTFIAMVTYMLWTGGNERTFDD